MERLHKNRFYPAAMFFALIMMVFGLIKAETPTAPKGTDAPDNSFSAARAFADLTDLLKENIPHPTGSKANKVIRDRIITKMQARGFDVSLQRDFVCQQHWAVCGNVENIVALKKGSTGKSTILLMAHYDGVPAGAAATDDGMGVATGLEIARLLQHIDTLENNLIILFTDGEEVGLLGAEAFAAKHPLAKTIDLVINVEARGTSGQSAMFETGSDNNELLNIYQNAVNRPFANSLTYEVYKRMPNDTDYTVFRKREIPGLNFASTGSGARYHSVFDDLEHLDKATLQQHGDNALAMITELGNKDLSDLPERSGDATYFDLYSLLLVKWPSSLNIPLSVLGLFTLIGFIVYGFKSTAITAKATVWSFTAIVASIGAAIALPALLAFPLGIWQDLHPIDHPSPWPGKTAMLLSCLLGLLCVSRAFKSRINAFSITLICWLLIAAVSLALSLTISGASYMALAPLIAFMAGLVIDYFRAGKLLRKIEFFISAYAGFFMAAYIGLYHFNLLDLVFNFNMGAAKAATLSLAAVTILPITTHYYSSNIKTFRVHATFLSAMMAASTVAALQVPGFTAEKPDPLNILHIENADTKEAFFTLEHYLTPEGETSKYFSLMGFPSDVEKMPFTSRFSDRRPIKTAPFSGLIPPSIEIISDTSKDDIRTIEAVLSAGHKGRTLRMMFSEGTKLHSFEMKGMPPLGQHLKSKQPTSLNITATQEDSFPFKVTLDARDSFNLTLFETGPLPDTSEAKALLALRPPTANRVQSSDRSIVYREIEF